MGLPDSRRVVSQGCSRPRGSNRCSAGVFTSRKTTIVMHERPRVTLLSRTRVKNHDSLLIMVLIWCCTSQKCVAVNTDGAQVYGMKRRRVGRAEKGRDEKAILDWDDSMKNSKVLGWADVSSRLLPPEPIPDAPASILACPLPFSLQIARNLL